MLIFIEGSFRTARAKVKIMQFRHEIKHEISRADLMTLRHRLRALLRPDPHAQNGIYDIRSLYFDNVDDQALREKVYGVTEREKYRIRLYNLNTDFINFLSSMPGVESAVAVSYNGDYMD